MEERESFWQTRLAEVCERKDNEIEQLRKSLELSEHNSKQLVEETKENCKCIVQLQARCKLLDEMHKLAPALESAMSILKRDKLQTQGTDCGESVDQNNTISSGDGKSNASTPTGGSLYQIQNTNSGSLSDSGYNPDSENTSPLQNMARTFRRNNLRHFSISEDDDDDEERSNITERDNVLRKLQSQRNTELYL